MGEGRTEHSVVSEPFPRISPWVRSGAECEGAGDLGVLAPGEELLVLRELHILREVPPRLPHHPHRDERIAARHTLARTECDMMSCGAILAGISSISVVSPSCHKCFKVVCFYEFAIVPNFAPFLKYFCDHSFLIQQTTSVNDLPGGSEFNIRSFAQL